MYERPALLSPPVPRTLVVDHALDISFFVPCLACRGTLGANLADTKSELERTRRLAREAAESGRKDAEDALERQVTT